MENEQKNVWIAFLVGILFICVSVFSIKSNVDKKKRMDAYVLSSKVTHVERRHRKRGRTYSPRFHYTVNGNKYICKANTSSNKKLSRDSYKVYYNSKDPSDCMPETASEENIFFVILFAIGLGTIYAGFQKMDRKTL